MYQYTCACIYVSLACCVLLYCICYIESLEDIDGVIEDDLSSDEGEDDELFMDNLHDDQPQESDTNNESNQPQQEVLESTVCACTYHLSMLCSLWNHSS